MNWLLCGALLVGQSQSVAGLDPTAPGDVEIIIITHHDSETDGGDPAGEDGPQRGDEDEIIVIGDADDGGAEPPAVGGASPTPATQEIFPNAGRVRAREQITSRLMLDTRFDAVDEDIVEWWNTGRLELDYRESQSFSAVAEALVRWGGVAEDPYPDRSFLVVNGARPKWTGEVELRQAHLQYRRGGWVFGAGQKIYVWGKNELFAPADVINPIDLRFDPVAVVDSPKDAKVPVFAFDAGYWWGDSGIELVAVPFFRRHAVFATGRDFALAAPGSALQAQLAPLLVLDPSIEDALQEGLMGTEIPEESLPNSTLALRGNLNAGGWDFAATVYAGWDRTPRIYIDDDLRVLLGAQTRISAQPDALLLDSDLRNSFLRLQRKGANGEKIFGMTYQRQWIFALEAEGVVGDFVLRADVGYTPRKIYYTHDFRSKARPTWNGVFGAEYMRGEEFFVQLTVFGTAVLNAPADQPLMMVEDPDAEASKGRVAMLYGAATHMRWSPPDWNLELGFVGMASQPHREYAALPTVRYKGLSPHILGAGLLMLGGPSGSLGGLWQRNDFVYVDYGATW